MKVTTNKKECQFYYASEVPTKIVEEYKDYLPADEAGSGYIKAKGVWYHISDFLRLDAPIIKGNITFHGYCGQSYFNAVLLSITSSGGYVLGYANS